MVKSPKSLVREAHFHYKDFPAIKDVLIVDEIRLARLEFEFVPVGLLWIDNIGASGFPDTIANIVGFDGGLDGVVVEGGFEHRLDPVSWPYIEGRRSAGISILDSKLESLSLLRSFFKPSAHWRNPSPRTDNQRFSRQLVRFDHLPELASVNNRYDCADTDTDTLNHVRWIVPPFRNSIYVVLAFICFGLPCFFSGMFLFFVIHLSLPLAVF
jgi:hypothetical protein